MIFHPTCSMLHQSIIKYSILEYLIDGKVMFIFKNDDVWG